MQPAMCSDNTFPGKRFFDDVYTGPAPWDIGAPQPDLMHLIEEFPPRGRILELGCGTGDLAIGLARTGRSVLGIDFAEAAIDTALSRLLNLPPDQRSLAEFRVGDALHLSEFAGEIESVADSGFLHLFDAATRLALVGELGLALPRGGRYYMLGFAVSLPAPDVPREVTQEDIAALFSREAGWAVRISRPARFWTRGFDDIPAVALCAERSAGPEWRSRADARPLSPP